MKLIKTLAAVVVFMTTTAISAQAPTWVPTTPSVGTVGPLSVQLNYGINMTGTVYLIIFNSNVVGPFTSAQVKTWALAGPSGGRVVSVAIPIIAGQQNLILSQIFALFDVNRQHAAFIVAESSGGTLQAAPIRLPFSTLPCPKIQLFNFFGNFGECVNLGAQGMFQVAPLGLLPTGIMAGSQWTIDWGDGSPIWTYISSADNDLPGIQLHNFSTTINCAYVGTWTVKNPCNEFYAVQGVFVVHGREIPLDGDGLLQMQETTTGDVDIVYVCEGAEHNIVLRDISTWNCQNPNVPPPLLPGDYDNDKPRTIQYVYGETPAGAVMNTITGTVFIGGSNPADAGNGYVGPVQGPFAPPNPGTLTDVITIPATCQVGERFYVYLKDWNKCNPFVDQNLDYVSEDFIIEVIDAPPVPVVVSPQTYCFGSVPATISAGITVAGNTINWYSDAALTNLLFNGNPYTHGQTAVGSYTYYATQTSGVNGCEGPAAPLTLVINPIPNTPTVTRNNPDFCFDGVSSITLTANPNTPPAISSYQWYRNGSAVVGATLSTIVLSTVAQSGNYTVQTYGIAPSLCPSPLSAVTTVTIGNPATVNAGVDQNICSSTATVSLTGLRGGSATSSTWTTSGTGTFANPSALNTTYTHSAADRTAGTVTLTLTTDDPAGPCPAASDAMVVTISPAATVNAGPDQSICALATATLAGSIGGGAANGTWSGGTGTYIPNANALNAVYTPSAAERTAGTVTLILTTDDPAGPCGAVSDNMTITIGSSPTSATITGTDVCIGQPSLIRVTIVSGAPNYTLTIPEYAGSPVLNYVSGTDINVGILTAGPHTFTLSAAQDACGNAVPGLPKTTTVTVNANNTVSVASSTPTLCISTPLTAITHTTTGATGIGAAVGLPAGVTAAWAANTITISGTPTASGVFNYSIPLAGGCGVVNATGTITVTANNTVSAASSTPTLCISTPLTAITHTTTGATGIGAAVGLPAGVTAAWAANTITISGTPTASGVFNYSIPLTGGCGVVNATGMITVITANTVSAASSTPTLCISTPLAAITHTTTGATGIGAAVGLPAGVTAAWAANTITITGTPTATGVFNYSIPLTGGCGVVNATGTITVTANNTVTAASSTPTLCISTPLTAITHTTTGATGIGAAVGLPAGVTAAWVANTITISGTPTASGVFNYSIPLTGGCGVVNATGTITVTANKTVSAASSTPTLCISTPLTAITHTTTGATGIGAAVGLPAGVTAAWAANTITISGTPTASGVFNYSIPLTGGCGVANATGTITVTANKTVSAASSTPTLCISTPLTAITHTTTGATGIGAAVGLPAGVTAAWAANTITIIGTPTASGVFNYSIPLTGGCGAANATGTITVITNNTVSAASSTPTLCISTPLAAITHTTTGATGIGAAVGLPAGVTAAWAANTITITGTPTASGVFNYSIPLTGGCGAANATGTITVTANKTVSAASSTPTLCINTPLTAITHTTTGATGIGAAVGLPAGVTAAWAANTITISGTPTASGVFNYSIPLTGGCGVVNATGTITVTANKTVSAASSTPTLCISTPLTAITHTTTGATGIGAAVGLPAGVTAAWAANTITISGTPTASGVFNYSIPLTGGCGVANATGTITVTANKTVSAASSTPTLCISTPLTAITHTTTGATGIGAAVGLPAGVTAAWAANTITISGTPTASGVFNYSIPLTGGCGAANATGTITVITNNTVSGASSTPTLCISTPLAAITHTTTGATGIGAAVGLPAGVTAAWAANTITISGTPTATGVFNYSIPLTGGCGVVNATGTITVTANNTVSAASSTPTLCISTPLTAITHTTTGATGIGAAVGLPAGVTAAWAANTITISGTPTASGVFNYSIPLTGGCGSANATGTITVITNNTVSAASSTPGLCINTPLTAITHTTTGATGIGAAVGLPAGVTAAWAANTITISGTPTASGVFNYSIPLTGGCGTANATGTITVVSIPATPAITGQAVVCGPGANTFLYKIGDGTYFIPGNAYVWTVPAGATRIAGGGLADNFILLSFPGAGPYTLQVTENTTVPVACYGMPQSYTINVYNNPVPNAGTPETICQGDAAILGGTPNGIGPSASGGTGSYTYSWLPTYGLNNPAAEHPSANPAVTITYQLMVTDVTSGCISIAPSSVLVTVNPVPTVIMPPLSQTKCIGDVAVFAATVSGNSYQWEISTDNGGTYSDVVDDATYDNVTSTSLTVNNIAMSMSGYMYRLRVIGLAPCAPVRTSAATLTVNNSPAITLQPVDATVCEAGFATFTSTASDAFTYQWYVSTDGGGTYNPVANGGNYFGATTTTLNVLNIPAGFNTYRYKMAATGLCNPVAESNAAILTVNTNIVITSQPAAVTQCEGTTAMFSVAATGTGLTYQWLKNGIILPNGGDISGATTSTLTIANIETADEANYSVAVTGTCNSAVSNAAPLIVNDNVVITVQPVSATRCAGTIATFSVTATGTGLSYQWRKGGINLIDGGNISGVATATLTINNAATADEGSYDVVITGLCSSVTSNAAVLTVDDDVTITTQPTAVTQCEGTTATFSVAATGTNLTYRWRKDGINLTNGGDISGATTPTLSIATIATADEGLYDVVITGDCSSETSTAAQLSVNDNIVITGQPVNVTQCEGTNAVFTVVNTGTGPVTYQWRKGGVNLADGGKISGSATATLTVSNIATADEGSYDVIVAGLCSTVTSTAALLGVDDNVVITVQPVAVTQCEGTTAMFSVTATGTGLTYQWRKDGLALSNTPAISGVYTSTLTINNIQTANEGTYDVVVSGTCVPATSNGAVLAVDDKPVITLQPASVVQCEGTTAIYSVTATGTGLTYQWRKGGVALVNGGDISGAMASTLNIANIETADEGSYDVIITGTCGTVTSSVVQLTVDDNVVITVQPVDVTQCEGTLASFTVSATGTGPLSYQWRKGGVALTDGGNIAGSATTNLRISNILTADEATYTVVVTGKCTGATSAGALLNVDDKVVITAQPVAVTQCEGSTATFSVTATGTNLLYQWRKGAVNIVDGGDISGALSATLTINNIETADEGLYYVVITGKCSSEISSSVQLTVDDNAVITAQPVNVTKCEGTVATFSVTATGTGLNYQWRKGGVNLIDGGNISGVATATLTINNAATADEGSYDVVITGLCSNVTSTAAMLAVDDNAVITTQPTAVTQCEGTTATFSVVATGTNLTYRWRKDGINLTNGGDISGATTPTLSIATIATADEGLYDVVITGDCSSETSTAAQLSVNDNIVITGQPVNVTQCEGTNAVFTVVNTGTGPVTYQWRKGGVNLADGGKISGSATATLTVSNIATADEGSYDVIVAGLCSTVTSTAALLGVDDNVVITVQPVAVTQCEGTTAMFSVTATGTGLTYQWRKDGLALSNTPAISGVYTSTLTINNIQTANEGTYDVVVSGTCVPATSNGAVLAVDDKPVITLQPASVVQCEGTTAIYSVTATGTGLTYQWRKGGVALVNGGDISGAMASTLNIANIETADEGSYDVIITGTCGTVTSSVVQLTVDDNVVITVQPVDVTQCEGTLASFTVSATGTGPLSYQWRKGGVALTDGGNIAGSATTNLRISNILTADEATYTVVVTGKCTGATSAGALLNVDDKVVITAQPVAVTQCEGSTATFSVTATGTNLLYQWRKGAVNIVDGGDISGALSATLTINNIETADEGLYYVVITGKCSSEISSSVQLTVDDNAVITAQPVNVTKCEGTVATFSVTATGTGLNYQWRKGGVNLIDGGNISGVATATLTINNAATADEGSYDVVITGLCSNVTSTAAMLAVDDNAVITTQPTAVTQCEGTTATFSVVATGTNLTYRWRKDGVPLSDAGDISGATTPTLSIATIATTDEGLYDVVVTGLCSAVTSNGVLLGVDDNVVITTQPVNVTTCEGDAATFSVTVTGTGPITYQWRRNGANLSDAGDISGSLTSTLTIANTEAADMGSFDVIITGLCSTVTSSAVALAVSEKPEIITQPVSATVCAGEDAVFTADAGITTNPIYQWYVNPGSGWTPAVGARYQGATTNTLTVVSALEIMSGYQYRLRVSGSCAPFVESNIVTLTVTRQAEITQHPVSVTVCETDPVSFTVNAGLTTNPSYQWEISTDGGGTWGPIPGANSATYAIASAATADNGHAFRAVVTSTCGSGVTSFPAYLTVNELPEIIDQPDDVTICEYAIADFIVDAGVTTGATYRWQRSDDGGATWPNLTESATYFGVSTMNLKVNGTQRIMNGDQFRVVVTGICTPPVTSNAVTLTVQTAPEILAQPVSSSICENTNTSFSVTAQGTAINYLWYVDTGTGFNPVVNGGVYAGASTNTLTLTNVPRTYDNYRYRVEVTGTCMPMAVSATVQLDVSIATIINTQPADTTICEFMTASFSAVADGANLTYQWQAFISGAWTDLTNTGLYIGVQTTMLMVFGPARTMDGTRYRVVIGSDCSADLISGEAVLTVYTAPELSDHPDEFRGCPGGNATFSVVAAGSNLVYQWQVNTGSGFNNVTDNATYSGTSSPDLTISNLDLTMNGYLVRAVVSGTCLPPVTSSFAPLRVYMEPSIISEPADAEVCYQAGVTYYSQVFNTGAGETTVWQVNPGAGWISLSDGALYQGTQTPQLVIMSADTIMTGWHYRFEITGPCGLYYTRDALLTVNAPPRAYIANVDTLLVCGGIPTQLHGNPAGGSLSYAAHRWFGDIGPLSAYTIENPIFNTSMPGYYRLIYQVTDSKGCVGLDTLVVQVEKPVAMFTVDAPSGCQPLTVNFTNGSIGYASVLWNFGDTTALSTDINPQHTYYNAGPALAYFTVELEVTSANGCISTMTNGITVYPEILSDFTMSDDTICSGESITFSLLPGAFRYFWNFGDGQSENGANVINHVFMNMNTTPVTYDVILTTESFFGCQSADTMQVVVYPTPVPGFTAAPVSQTFPNATVTFTNNTNAGTWIWLWDFADGNSSAIESPLHTYAAPGEYAVSLTASNAVCTETVTHNVSVLPTPPIASFDPIPSGCMPWNISINNTSLYATTYYWDFGDGYTSNARNPVYTYVQAGSYQVTLTVQGPGGSDTEQQMVYVYQAPRAYFEVSPIKVYVNDEKVRMFNLTEGADSFVWEFGDGDTSHLRDPYHKYTTEGIYDITLHAYSANGCYDTYVLSPAVTVEPFGKLVFATVFKPNQDGPIEIDELPTSGDAIDQFFFPPIRETVLNYHMQIFNRWGALIFETYDINKPWNGYYKGKLCAQGVYVWLVEGKYANGRPFKEAGDITLLH